METNVIQIYKSEPDDKISIAFKLKVDKSIPYYVIGCDVFKKALRDLTPEGFKLWIYLRSFSQGWEVKYKQDRLIELGITNDEDLMFAQQELIRNKYIKKYDGKLYFFENNNYSFSNREEDKD